MDGHTLHALFGSYDNSGEPQPLVNRKSTILGVIITFAVRMDLGGGQWES